MPLKSVCSRLVGATARSTRYDAFVRFSGDRGLEEEGVHVGREEEEAVARVIEERPHSDEVAGAPEAAPLSVPGGEGEGADDPVRRGVAPGFDRPQGEGGVGVGDLTPCLGQRLFQLFRVVDVAGEKRGRTGRCARPRAADLPAAAPPPCCPAGGGPLGPRSMALPPTAR